MSTTMKAIVAHRNIFSRLLNVAAGTSHGQGVSVLDVPKPSIADDQILVKVKAVTLNPTDFKHIDALSPPGSIIGCDYAGEVVQVGTRVSSWSVGDRVAGVVHGGLFPDRGSFAEFLKTDADLAWRIPSGMSDTDAASYGVSAVTAMLSINIRFGLPWATPEPPKPKDEHIFIYAGSTSVGLYHVQIAKAAGYKVVTTASPRSEDLVRRYGADAVFDYNLPTLAADITARFPGISRAIDCFSEGKSSAVCAAVVEAAAEGRVLRMLPGKFEYVMMYTLFGREFQILPPVGPKYPASPADRAGLVKFYEMLPGLTHVIKPVPVAVSEGGFDQILAGIDKLRHKQVSGGKLGVIMG